MKAQVEQVLAAIVAWRAEKGEEAPLIVAIDGRCASGKTTLAARLQDATGCQVIHMDDFFLRPEQRSAERLAKPGENVDWERLIGEVLTPLRAGQAFSYRPFDCHSLGFKAPIHGQPAALTLLEGSYSCNAHLWDYSDRHIFMTIEPEEQAARILKRNGPAATAVFREKWIPLEEAYFEASAIENRCDLRLEGSQS